MEMAQGRHTRKQLPNGYLFVLTNITVHEGLKPDLLRTALKQDTALTAQSIHSEESGTTFVST